MLPRARPSQSSSTSNSEPSALIGRHGSFNEPLKERRRRLGPLVEQSLDALWTWSELQRRASQHIVAAIGLAAQVLHPLRRIVEGGTLPVLPDCCNVGVVIRILSSLGVGLALGALVLAENLAQWPTLFLHGLALVATVVMTSLAGLCVARPWVAGRSPRVQWTVGIAVPTCLMLTTALLSVHWGGVSPPEPGLWIMARTAAAAALAAVMLEYFLLRARAYSPSFTEARLIALQARIRPHFLFNSLNTVLGLIRTDVTLAESTLQDLAELFRVFMRDTRELVPLAVELETCRQYLAIEILRLKPRLEVKWLIDELPGDALVPSLLIQPLIENAVHHGIEPLTETGVVSVTGACRGERIWIEVVNPLPPSGRGAQRMGNQMALGNVRERLMLLYDMEAELQTRSEHNQFRLTLEFPYRRERRGHHD